LSSLQSEFFINLLVYPAGPKPKEWEYLPQSNSCTNRYNATDEIYFHKKSQRHQSNVNVKQPCIFVMTYPLLNRQIKRLFVFIDAAKSLDDGIGILTSDGLIGDVIAHACAGEGDG
jgi:hypothetical protein